MHPASEILRRTYRPEAGERARSLAALTHRLGKRGGYPTGHTEAVSGLAVAIAVRLGLRDDELAEVALGGLLHDVGKVEVPESILGKASSLDELEWHAMRRHAESGARLVHSVVDLPGVLAVVRWHHERWDGTGYPDGMRGEQIPLPARIVAVADAFQAMLETRPYRNGRTESAALEELRRHAGSQFDPDCVDALAAVLDD